ncbi:MAG: 50S ribosomal protein L25 [Planctomycetaceae bacterium]|jgi:large subunit ribosomal protein L25|nr:50S ribosomal protein L25 [Planctomycetaceae bacterium]
MAKVHSLTVKIRDTHGKRRVRRLRNTGAVPAILYGHKQEPKSLSLVSEEIESAVRHGNHFVALTGEVSESAFIKQVQWDTWGNEILHVDFARVSAHEKVRVAVALELRGESPGTKEGGVVKHVLHTVELECEASAVPDKIDININHLEFGQAIHVKDIEFPQSAVPLIDGDTLVVSCAAPVEESEEETAGAGEGEPEVIGRKKEEEAET